VSHRTILTLTDGQLAGTVENATEAQRAYIMDSEGFGRGSRGHAGGRRPNPPLGKGPAITRIAGPGAGVVCAAHEAMRRLQDALFLADSECRQRPAARGTVDHVALAARLLVAAECIRDMQALVGPLEAAAMECAL